jgi:hypothetical protein
MSRFAAQQDWTRQEDPKSIFRKPCFVRVYAFTEIQKQQKRFNDSVFVIFQILD